VAAEFTRASACKSVVAGVAADHRAQQYQVQFSTTEAHVRLIERAKALLASFPN